MSALMTLSWAIIAFIIMIGVLVFVHESGHFIAAKIFRVKVLIFAFGFGPWLVHKKIGETDYGIKPIPIGGFVKLFGDPTEQDQSEEKITPEDEKRALYAQSGWKRFIIFGAGSIMNIALAFAIAPSIYWLGIEKDYFDIASARVGAIIPDSPAQKAGIKPGDLILKINSRKVKNFQDMITTEMLNPNQEMVYEIQRGSSILFKKVHLGETPELKAGFSGIFLPGAQAVVGRVMQGSPADKAGIKPDDKVLSIDGHPIHYWHEMTGFIQASKGKSLELAIQSGSERLNLTLVPEYNAEARRYLVGIEQKIQTVFVRYGFFKGIEAGFGDAYYWMGLTFRTIGKLFSGEVSYKAMSGPVGIANIAGQAAQAGLAHFILLLVIISVNLGILNLIPIPPLDGGHILITAIETISRRKLNKQVKEAVFTVMFFLLIAFMILITFNDLLRISGSFSKAYGELLKSFGIK